MDALAFLQKPGKGEIQQVYIIHGDEGFLKRQVLGVLRTLVLGKGDDFGLSTHAGDKASFADVAGELETLPFLCPRRLVIVENADPFVTKYRTALEKYLAKPANGVLVLDVKSLPSNTKLAKQLPEAGGILCKGPAPYKVPDWCVRWALSQYQKNLSAAAARLLVDFVGPDMGLLDQELAKLAIFVGQAAAIEIQDVDQLVGRSRTENVFKIFDAIAQGNLAQAFSILENLFDHGEEPIRILGAFSMQLRRLAQAARLVQQKTPAYQALERTGVPPFARESGMQQLRQLGRERTDRLFDWLLEADLGMKGSSQLSPQTILERLVIRLGRPMPSDVRRTG